MMFFCGWHHPHNAHQTEHSFVSVHSLKKRKSDFPRPAGSWILDSGAFTTIGKHGGYPDSAEAYAAQIRRWAQVGGLIAAVAQDFMCERLMCAKTLGFPVETLPKDDPVAREAILREWVPDPAWQAQIIVHQRLTIERYDELVACDTGGVYIMPVLQGFTPEDYVSHLKQYGERLAYGAWVGVGSVCKRNGSPKEIAAVLLAIKAERPDLRLHGFGLKLTSLRWPLIVELLESADSLAWSISARMQKRKANDPAEALRFVARAEYLIDRSRQGFLPIWGAA